MTYFLNNKHILFSNSRKLLKSSASRRFVSGLIGLFIFFSTTNIVLAAEIKCWVNDQSIRECGSQIPQKYNRQRIEILSNQGTIIKVIDAAKTDEELKKEAKLEEKKAAQALQDKKDRTLLKAYTTERDLLIARDNKILTIQTLVEITEANNKMVGQYLEKLQKQAANHERNGKALPPTLVKNMQKTQEKLDENAKFIEEKFEDQEKIRETYAGILKRFRKLKGIITE